uniref:Glycerate kinase n=1 Tax=Nothoprocta perdicaria TaxID=30464 RepID=A0A8C6YYU7_NOTPE
MLLKPGSRIEVMEGARDNRPDAAALRAAGAIRALAEGLGADDVLLVLISGGGSALLPAPTPPVLLEEKEALTRLLAARGAAIQELNAVRKALSVLKGGGLARLAHPARVVSLILSDVIGDPVDVIASGPTAASAHGAQDCLRILAKYDLLRGLPASVQAVLGSAEPAAPHDYSHVANVVVGSNALALAEAKQQHPSRGCPLFPPAAAGDTRTRQVTPPALRDELGRPHGPCPGEHRPWLLPLRGHGGCRLHGTVSAQGGRCFPASVTPGSLLGTLPGIPRAPHVQPSLLAPSAAPAIPRALIMLLIN